MRPSIGGSGNAARRHDDAVDVYTHAVRAPIHDHEPSQNQDTDEASERIAEDETDGASVEEEQGPLSDEGHQAVEDSSRSQDSVLLVACSVLKADGVQRAQPYAEGNKGQESERYGRNLRGAGAGKQCRRRGARATRTTPLS